MIVDLFMFDDEFDVLECRLYELDGLVDLHVAVEGDHAFSGLPKPYHLSESGRYDDRVRIIRAETGSVDDIDDDYLWRSAPWCYQSTHEFWRREVKQRDAVEPLLASLPPETTILVGDLDEIPGREVLRALRAAPRPASVLRMLHCLYDFSWVHPHAWWGTVIGTIGELGTRPSYVRANRGTDYEMVVHGGWHLSWFGDAERRKEKLAKSAHQEWSDVGDRIGDEYPLIGKHLNGTDLIRRDPVSLPRWVIDGHAPASWLKERE